MTNHPISLCDRFGLAAETRPFVPSFLPPERLPKLTPEDVRKLVWEGGLPGAEGRRGKARAAFFEERIDPRPPGRAPRDAAHVPGVFERACVAHRPGTPYR